MKITKYILLICFIFLGACHKDIPEPEVKSKLSVIPMSSVHTSDELPVVAQHRNNNQFMVQHHVKESNVFVECIVSGITFRDQTKGKKGKIILFIDGQKKEEIHTAAFIIKGLSRGDHVVKIEVVDENNQSYSLSKEFEVTIP